MNTTTATKDATNIFIALASFALAESTALTVVARDDDKQWLVLSIYIAVVVFTIYWIVHMLWVGRSGREGIRFDRTSLHYGYITLVWMIVLAGIMVALAWFRLLPNQTSRRFLPMDEISVMPAFRNDRKLGELESDSGVRLTSYEEWMELTQLPNEGNSQRGGKFTKSVVWLVQRESFDDHYRSKRFEIRVLGDTVELDAASCGDVAPSDNSQDGKKRQIRIIKRAAFLVRVDPQHKNPSYRQLPFSEKGNGLGCDFLLIDPNPGERLVVVLEIRHRPDVDLKNVQFAITKK